MAALARLNPHPQSEALRSTTQAWRPSAHILRGPAAERCACACRPCLRPRLELLLLLLVRSVRQGLGRVARFRAGAVVLMGAVGLDGLGQGGAVGCMRLGLVLSGPSGLRGGGG